MPNNPRDYIERCPYCKAYLLSWQVKEHKCDQPLNDVKEIPVIFSYETHTEKGLAVVIAMGFDGILYRLVKCKNPLADDWKQHSETDEEVPEPT